MESDQFLEKDSLCRFSLAHRSPIFFPHKGSFIKKQKLKPFHHQIRRPCVLLRGSSSSALLGWGSLYIVSVTNTNFFPTKYPWYSCPFNEIESFTEIFGRKEHRCLSLGMNQKKSRHIPVSESSFKYYNGYLKEALLLSDSTLRLPAPLQTLQKKPIYPRWALTFHFGHQAPKKLSSTLDLIQLFSKYAGTNMWMK